MGWVALYLYLVGAAFSWWWARAQQDRPTCAKVLMVVLWPVIVPLAAFL